MKKVALILALSLVFVLAFATASFAGISYTLTHTGFSSDTSACAGCHVTHSANLSMLLKGTGITTQTGFCYQCHDGSGTSSPYDVEDGMVQSTWAASNNDWATAAVYASPTGGFGFKSGGKPYADFAATSRHNIDTPTTLGIVYNEDMIPGNNGSVSANGLTFRCGSCHDPHGTNTGNKRLLRTTIFGSSENSVVINTYGAGSKYEYVTKDYGSVAGNAYANAQSIDNWCGLCHGKFVQGHNAATTADGTSHYRHAVGVRVFDYTGFDTSLASGVPLSGGTGQFAISCLTCHRAHGSAATVTSYSASFKDDADSTRYGSALLRRNERGVCYECHGGAVRNLN